MAEERNTRRELLRRMLTLGPVAALATVFGGNGAKPAEAADGNFDNLYVTGVAGIGTTSPAEKLEVDGNIKQKWPSGTQYFGWNYTLGGTYQAGMRFVGGRTLDLFSVMDDFASAVTITTGTGPSNGERVRITNGGNVGIGTTSPVYPLDVVGDIRLTGLLRGSAQSAYYSA